MRTRTTPKTDDKPKPAKPAKPRQLFVATTSAYVNETIAPSGLIRKGEVAIEGAKVLKTVGHLFKPLEITYHA